MAQKEYKAQKSSLNIAEEPLLSYQYVDDGNVFNIMKIAANGIRFNAFVQVVERSMLSFREWAEILHISDRTMMRYSKSKKPFDMPASEKIIEVSMLMKLGEEVFGSQEAFHAWLGLPNMALGKITPKMLLKSRFGIEVIKSELGRIAHGVLA